MDYNDFILRISPAPEAGRFVVSAQSATAGEASGSFVSPFSDTELENFILRIGLTRRGVRRINSPEWRAAQVFGEKLFRQLFAEDIRSTFLASRNDALREGKGLRVKFIIDAPALANYPWEFLYDPSLGRFLSLYEATPIVRYVELSSPPQVLRVAPPLRVLVIASSPSDYPPLDLAREKNNLDSALAELVQQNQIAVDWLPNASLEALRSQLLKRQYHIFHFIGHGGFDESAQDGVLVFEDEAKRSRPIGGEQLAVLLGNHRTLQLAILNACEGARTSTQDPFAGAAMTLVKSGGVSAVVAMQFEITDEASIAFSRGFYGALAVGSPVDAAVAQARLSIFAEDNDVEWGTPVLYLRAPDGVIFEPLPPEEVARLERGRAEKEQREKETIEAERLAREQAEHERAAREQAEQERLAQESAEQDRLAREKAQAERLARENTERERVAQVAQLYTVAQQQFAKKNYTDALNTLASSLALDPANSNALELKANVDAARTEQERLAKEKATREQELPSAKQLTAQVLPSPETIRGNVREPAASTSSRRATWLVILAIVGVLLCGVCAWFAYSIAPGGPNLPLPTPTRVAVIATSAPTATPTIVMPTSTNTVFVPSATPLPPTPIPTATPSPVTPTPALGIGSTRVGNDGATMMFVPSGNFLMGSTSSDSQANSNEKPQHTVYLDSFWVDKFEVTNALYKKCVDAGKCQPPNLTNSITRDSYYGNSQFDNYPVIYVSWSDANAYCAWAGKRLPTEAEWEKAARGTEGRIYPWGNTFDKNLLNSSDGGRGDTTAVGSYPGGASPYGVMDMAGNVWEWVADWYDANYYADSPFDNPTGPSSGTFKGVRGGSWSSRAFYVRAVNRSTDFASGNTSQVLGFRCAK